jgi:predicted dehydrogenase
MARLKRNICLVGCGYWGRNLLRNLNSLGLLAGAFDLDAKIIKSYSQDRNFRDVYFDTDWEKCLSKEIIKGVVIATPPRHHYDIAMVAMKAGKHVFIEKPMTLDIDEAEDIVQYAKENSLIVMTGHIFLYSPEFLKLKDIITSKDFGNVLYIYTKRLNLGQVQACGVINDLLPHDISIINYLLDKKCDSISVYGASNILKGIEDVAFVNMKYGKVSVNCHLSWLDPLKDRSTVVVGTKQMAVCDSISKSITIYNKGVDLGAMEEDMSIDYARHLLGYRYGDVVSPHIQTWEPLAEECKEFVSCIEENRQPLSGGEFGLSVVRTLNAAKCSLESHGEWVSI